MPASAWPPRPRLGSRLSELAATRWSCQPISSSARSRFTADLGRPTTLALAQAHHENQYVRESGPWPALPTPGTGGASASRPRLHSSLTGFGAMGQAGDILRDQFLGAGLGSALHQDRPASRTGPFRSQPPTAGRNLAQQRSLSALRRPCPGAALACVARSFTQLPASRNVSLSRRRPRRRWPGVSAGLCPGNPARRTPAPRQQGALDVKRLDCDPRWSPLVPQALEHSKDPYRNP